MCKNLSFKFVNSTLLYNSRKHCSTEGDPNQHLYYGSILISIEPNRKKRKCNANWNDQVSTVEVIGQFWIKIGWILTDPHLGCENAVWGAAECESVAAAAANHRVARATEAGLVFLWQAQSPGGCWQCLQGLASPQPLLAAPHQEWGRTLQADVLEQQGRPGRGWGWELLQRQQLKWKSRLTTMLSSVCGDIYLLAALVHWYSPCLLEEKVKSLVNILERTDTTGEITLYIP